MKIRKMVGRAHLTTATGETPVLPKMGDFIIKLTPTRQWFLMSGRLMSLTAGLITRCGIIPERS
jgi:hypothetical protein